MSDIKSTYDYDAETGLFRRVDTQDVESIVDQNKAERLSGDNDQKGKNGRKFASVPMVVLERWKQDYGVDYMLFGICPDTTVRFIKLLNDPENRAFRTSEAKLGNGNRFV